MMTHGRKTLLMIGGVVMGAVFVVVARLMVGNASWWMCWTVNAIGWLIIAAVVIPVCDHIKKREGN